MVSVLLYGCEAWTLLAEDERRIQAFEFKCLRKLMDITYLERKTNDYVRDRFTSMVGPMTLCWPLWRGRTSSGLAMWRATIPFPRLFHKRFFAVKEGSWDYKKVRKRWFFKETLTEWFFVEPQIFLRVSVYICIYIYIYIYIYI